MLCPVEMRNFIRKLLANRKSAKAFQTISKSDVHDKRLMGNVCEALALAQRSPSAFNIQPYRAVVVRDEMQRKQLSGAMVGGNIGRVLNAPVTVVWLADLQPWKLIDETIDLERRHSSSTEVELRNTSANAHFMLGESNRFGDNNATKHIGVLQSVLRSYLPDSNNVEQVANHVEMTSKKVLLNLLSQVTQAPTINSNAEAWSFKNTMLAVQSYILAMDAFGWSSSPMEGFDARRVLRIVSAPKDRYSIPVIVASGKPAVDRNDQQNSVSPRFSFEDMFSMDSFDFPLHHEDYSQSE